MDTTKIRSVISDKGWLNSYEAANYLSVSMPTLDRYCSLNMISYKKPKGVRYFKKEDLDAFIISGS